MLTSVKKDELGEWRIDNSIVDKRNSGAKDKGGTTKKRRVEIASVFEEELKNFYKNSKDGEDQVSDI